MPCKRRASPPAFLCSCLVSSSALALQSHVFFGGCLALAGGVASHMMQSGMDACRVHVALQWVLCSTILWQCMVETERVITSNRFICVEKKRAWVQLSMGTRRRIHF